MGGTTAGHSGWSSRSFGSSFQHRIFYSLIRFARPVADALLRIVVLYYALFRPSLRNRVMPYLSRRFSGLKGLRKLASIHAIDLCLGQVLVDRAALGILGPERIRVDFPERNRLLELLKEGKGLILISAHVGGWQVVMFRLNFLQVPINLLLHREEGDIDLHYFQHQGASPFRIIDPTGFMGGTIEMIDVLKKGEVLCVMGDRMLGSLSAGVSTSFLGGEVRFPFSAYKVATVTGTPVAVLFSYRTGPGSYRMVLAREIRVPAKKGRGSAALQPHVAQFAGALEDYVRQHPYQFFNFYDMWDKSNHEDVT